MELNKVDRNLLARIGRHLKDKAADQDTIAAAAIEGPRYRELKAKADRLHRDLRDLDLLRKRINGIS